MHYATGAEYCVSCDRKLGYDARSQFCQTCEIFNDGYDLVERQLQHMLIPNEFKTIWLAGAYGVIDRIEKEGEFFVPKNRGGEAVLHAMWVDAARNWNLNDYGRKILANGFRCALNFFVGADPRTASEAEAATNSAPAAAPAAPAPAAPAPAAPAPQRSETYTVKNPRSLRVMQWLTNQVLYRGLISRLIMLFAAIGFFAGFVSQVGEAGGLKLTALFLLCTFSLVSAIRAK